MWSDPASRQWPPLEYSAWKQGSSSLETHHRIKSEGEGRRGWKQAALLWTALLCPTVVQPFRAQTLQDKDPGKNKSIFAKDVVLALINKVFVTHLSYVLDSATTYHPSTAKFHSFMGGANITLTLKRDVMQLHFQRFSRILNEDRNAKLLRKTNV